MRRLYLCFAVMAQQDASDHAARARHYRETGFVAGWRVASEAAAKSHLEALHYLEKVMD